MRLAGGSLFLFNKKKLRFYRKDGHSWRKKADNKTVRETHEKLKVRFDGNSLTFQVVCSPTITACFACTGWKPGRAQLLLCTL